MIASWEKNPEFLGPAFCVPFRQACCLSNCRFLGLFFFSPVFPPPFPSLGPHLKFHSKKKKNSGLSRNKVIGCTVRRFCEELPIYLYTFLPSFLLFPLNAISNVTFPFQRKSRSKKCRGPGKKAIIYHYTFTLFCSFLCPFRDIQYRYLGNQ